MAAADRLTIAHVTPHPWGRHHEVNHFVERSAAELRGRGHRVVIAAPSDSRAAIRASRAAIRAARDDEKTILGRAWEGERVGGRDGAPVLAVGQAIPLPRGPRSRPAAVSFDPGRALEELLSALTFDIVHVHDPFTPSAAASALRHSWSLNIGTFHEPTERILSTQLARPLVEIFLGRLDARTSTSAATTALIQRYFPGSYTPLRTGADPDADRAFWPFPDREDGTVRILFPAVEERGALRLFIRALRRVAPGHPWEVAIWSDGPRAQLRLSRDLAARVRQVGPRDGSLDQAIAAADIVCLASGTGGADMVPGVVRQGLATRTVPVASQLPAYRELLAEGELGLTFAPGDAITLAGHLERLVSNHALRSAFCDAAPAPHTWADVAGELETLYEDVIARRHDTAGEVELRRKVSRRKEIYCDLHMHTDHSHDCATPVEVLLETAKDRGLGAIAITDHNEVSGAFAAREVAERIGIKVIVGEEVKTAEQGEVIGLFLTEKIERGMTMAETVAEIKRQGGLVYVPHPFDRLHSVPDYEHLLEIVEEIDILEVFNPRVAFSAFNDEADRFATKYGIVAGAGSDAHVAQAMGSVRIRLHDFDGPEEFLESMRSADIVRKHRNIAYVQMLKWMQTAGGSGGRRRSVPAARPARGGDRRAQRRVARRARGRGKS